MRIIVAHNNYIHRGGEDSVVESEIGMLRAFGHQLIEYRKDNIEISGISKVSLLLNTLWSRKTAADIKKLIENFQPDIIHVHNTFPLISPSLFWAANQAGIPVIQTLHNFRLLCLNAMFLRGDKVCQDCLGHLPLLGVARKCYRGSVVESASLASMITLHRGLATYRKKITKYIALNEFCRQKFIEGGLPASRIVVKPNFVDLPTQEKLRRHDFLFVGRLSKEKGIKTLMQAIKLLPGSSIRVAGVGPESELLDHVQGVVGLGSLSIDEVQHEMHSSMALVLPSLWFENFPRTIVEAFSCALPVIASRLGALTELVEHGDTGLLFEPGNPQDLAEKMKWATENPSKMEAMGRNARAKYLAEFTAERNHQQLISIYKDAIKENDITK
jgi:glycosyltransferase involved in cell wall biosynthesis